MAFTNAGTTSTYYGGLAVAVVESDTGIGALAGNPRRQHPFLHVVDAHVVVDAAPSTPAPAAAAAAELAGGHAPPVLHVHCTTRRAHVLRVTFADVHDVRRLPPTTATAGAVELEYSAVDSAATALASAIGAGVAGVDASGFTPPVRTYVVTVAAVRPDAARSVDNLYQTCLRMQRSHAHAVSATGGPTAAITAPAAASLAPTPHQAQFRHSHSQPQRAYPDESSQWPPRGGSSHANVASGLVALPAASAPEPAMWAGSSAIQNCQSELDSIRSRRRARQVRLVGAMVGPVGGYGDGGALSEMDGGAFVGDRDGAGVGFAPDAVSGASTDVTDLHWCRWCGGFQHGPHHARACPSRPVECSWCGLRMRRAQFDEHQHRCEGAPPPRHDPAPERSSDRARRSSNADRARDSADDDGAAAAAAESASANDPMQLCRWCKRLMPKSHEKTCPEHKTMCPTCLELIPAGSTAEAEHRRVCKKHPTRTAKSMREAGRASSPKPAAVPPPPESEASSAKRVAFQTPPKK